MDIPFESAAARPLASITVDSLVLMKYIMLREKGRGQKRSLPLPYLMYASVNRL